MKVVVTGTRGIPNIMGGVETHCEELFPRIAAAGHDVTVIRRSCYVGDDNHISSYKGVALKDIYAPRKKSLEAIVHTFLAVLSAYACRHPAYPCHRTFADDPFRTVAWLESGDYAPRT